MKQILLSFLLVFGVATQAQAFFVEPFLTYETGENTDDSTEEFTTMGFGARLGSSTLGFIYGLEYGTYSGDYDNGGTDLDFDGSDLGVTIGYDFPIMLRAYLTYFLMSKADVGTSIELEGSGGMRIGVGFTMLPFVNINIERITRTFDEQNGASISDEAEFEGYALGVSIPLP